MRRALAVVALLVLSGCAATPAPNPADAVTPSATSTAGLTSLRDAAVAAGYKCPDWQEDNATSASCSGLDRFIWFTSKSERDDSYSQMSGWLKNGMAEAVLFGPTWAINGQADKLQPIADALEGELLLSDKPASASPEVGRSCKGTGRLVRSSVEFGGDELVAKFELDSKPPIDTAESFGVFIFAANYEAGHGSYQAGVMWVDGRTQGPFIADLSGSVKQQNYPATDVETHGKVITVHFDAAPFKALGEGWQWRAAISANTRDLDGCPGGVTDFLVYGD